MLRLSERVQIIGTVSDALNSLNHDIGHSDEDREKVSFCFITAAISKITSTKPF